ncbi:primase C-terminal domain-containing protein, partial [Acinetobacter pseudolwoffii]|uniref:primase C-terminal domain-containing protein n=1 Tax=Acinetobacter pseudolwoffii TaxID=2053287 RepID=UPI003FD87490
YHNSSYEWEKAVYAQISAINNGFEEPLPLSEVKATAKSIAKWVWQRFSYGDFSEIQSKRGAKGGAKSKRSAKANSARSTKPWEALGVSRATYYRHKKNETK